MGSPAARSTILGRARLAAALLAAEFLGLMLFVELPDEGSALELVAAARLLLPILAGTGAAGYLLIRAERAGAPAPAAAAAAADQPPEGATLALTLAAQLAAFAATAATGVRLMGPGAGPVGRGAFAAWLCGAALCAVLAAALAASPRTLLRFATRHLAVPVLAVGAGVLAWRAMAAANALWGFLGAASLHGTAALLRAVGGDVVLDVPARLVGVEPFVVEIAPVCSGVDGLGLILVFQALWLSLARGRIRALRAALVLVPAGAAAALVANVLRIALLVLVGASGREELALGAFHSKLGWVLFLAVAFGIMAVAERAPWFARDGAGPAGADGALPAASAAYVAPLVAALAMALATSLFSGPVLDRWYALRLVAAAATLAFARRDLPRPALAPALLPLALAALTCALWLPAAGAPSSPLGAAVAALPPLERAAWVAARLAGAVVVVPVIEELAFRGFLLPWLAGEELGRPAPRVGWRDAPWGAILVSSAAFGALHHRFLAGTAAGIAFALARQWRGRLGDAVLAHAACNAGLAAAVLLAGRWDLWS